jgi:flagellar biogenesis protein FliO
MFVSLLIVIGLFLLVARIFRNLSPTPQRFLPKEVVQVIGRTPLAPRQQMYLIRFGNKVLLVSQQLGQTTTLSEIENPDEVAHLLGLCEQQSSTSISNSFRDVLQQITLGSTKKATKAPVRNPRTSASQFENLG